MAVNAQADALTREHQRDPHPQLLRGKNRVANVYAAMHAGDHSTGHCHPFHDWKHHMNKRPDTEATEIPACSWAEKLCEVLAEHALDGDSPALHAMRDALEKTGVADALKDAERYRWLRKEHKSDDPSYHVRRPSNCPAPRDLDADLDAAMKGASDQVER